MRVLSLAALLALFCLGQSSVPRPDSNLSRNSWIRGNVLNDRTGQPLSRARVYLRSMSAEAPSLVVDADSKGSFVIPNVAPGKYSLSAQRDGYLTGNVALTGSSRMAAIFPVEQGKDIRDITLRLQPWSVLAGRIRFGDAEPAIGVLVQIFQDNYARARRSFRLVSFARTNDRGEYRVAGMAPGSYYVAATYDRPVSQEFIQQDPVDESGKPVPQFRYSTTFYPSAQKLADALPVKLRAAEESGGLDIFLQPVRTVNIRGVTISGLSGEIIKVPSVSLRRMSSDERSSINAAISTAPKDGGFEIKGVAAGPYLLVADSIEKGRRLFARTPILVNEANLENLHVMLEPERAWRGTVIAADAPSVKLHSLRVVFEPRTDLNPIASAEVDESGGFTINVVPDEVYDAYILNGPDELYIKSMRVANADVDSGGISGQMAAPNVPIEIAISSRDASLAGRVYETNTGVAPGATVTVVPDPARGRPQYYRTGFADEYGLFQIRGLAPGPYTAFAYYGDDPPCEFYDVDALPACRAQGSSFKAGEGAQTLLPLRLTR